jgi:hypothetical protein
VTSLSRRSFVKGVAAVPLALWVARNARADGPFIRYDIASPMGQQMLQVYADTVRLMQARTPDDPFSWMWQWYTHFVDGATTKANEIARIWGGVTTPQSTLANEVWNTCQSHSGQNYNYFMPWHRMFMLYYESILRTVSGVPDFTLPYWNYTSDDPLQRGIVPLQFRLKDDPVWGSLYRPDRNSLANSGQRIDKNQTYDVMDISAAMACTSYSNVGSVQGFCRSIDNGIHGRIHVLTGNTKNMGSVPYAGKDPLFWTHHINIDRMWASWNLNGGPNPIGASWTNKSFVFVDANGQRVTSSIPTVFDTNTLGYTYDTFIPPAATATQMKAKTALAAAVTRPSVTVANVRGGVNLGAGPVHASLLPLFAQRQSSVLGLDDRQPSGRAYLVLKDLHTWAQPGVLYHLYLSPGRSHATLDRAHYVGNINFFDAQFHDHGTSMAMDMALGENPYSFDVTDLLQGFQRSGAREARDALLVTFVPGGRPEGGSPMVGSIELHRQ